MVTFIKKFWLFILLAALAALLTALWYLKPPEQPPQKITTITGPSLPGELIDPKTQINFSAQTQETKAPVLRFERKDALSSTELNTLAQKFGFEEKPNVSNDVLLGDIYNWVSEARSLRIVVTTHEITFKRNLQLSPPPETGQLPSQEIGRTSLFSFIKKIGFILPDGVVEKTRFISLQGPVPVTTSPEDAQLLEISLLPTFKGIPLVDEDPKMAIARVWIDKGGTFARFEWQNPIISLTPQEEYPLKTTQEIQQSLITEGRLVLLGGALAPESQVVSYITLSNITLSYLLHSEGNTAQPVFILSGDGRNFTRESSRVFIYLPAIKSQYLTQPSPSPTPGF
ncbi:hypothetical protein HY405_01530 [Candidatus Microgenomates bacterium]|nr:hypothetical protein [Candidatus Microgenomates bacterium]